MREQLGKLGGTPYHLNELSAELTGAGFLPVSALNALRREATARLTEQRGQTPARRADTGGQQRGAARPARAN